MKVELIYVAHPIGGNVEENLKDLFRILRKLNLEHPESFYYAPYVADVLSLKDAEPVERSRGLDNGTAIIQSGLFDAIMLTGDRLSEGMKQEKKHFEDLGLHVINKIGEL